MHPYRIYSTEIMELIDMAPRHGIPVLSGQHPTIRKYHPSIGQFEAHHISLPHILVSNVQWTIEQEFMVIDDEMSPDYIAVYFHTAGRVLSSFQDMGDVPLEANSHNLMYSPPAKHVHRFQAKQRMTGLNLSIDKSYFTKLILPEDKWSERLLRSLEKGAPFLGVKGAGQLSPRMLPLIQLLQQPPVWDGMNPFKMQSVLFELLALQIGQLRQLEGGAGGQTTINKQDADKLIALRAYIDQHFLDELSLTGLASIAMLNEFKLKKGFKVLFNIPVFGYVRQLRMQHALHLLQEEGKSVEAIASTLGYRHPHHFSASFKKHFGVIPSQWHKRRLR